MPRDREGDDVGLVLMQMGGPRSPGELAPFLRRLFQDPEMIRLPSWLSPLQGLLGGAYGTLRARQVQPAYEAIGWSSLVPTIQTIAHQLEDALDPALAGIEPAMRYTPPRSKHALQRLDENGATHAIALPLYPFYSIATTGSNLQDLRRARDEVAPGLTLEPVHAWGNHPGHIDLVAHRLEKTLHAADPDAERAILLTAHGIPRTYADDHADPYPGQVHDAARTLARRFPHERLELAYQSDVGPVEWLAPNTPTAIETLAQDGIEELVLVPFGFIADHIETLHEIDDEYAQHAHDHGIERVHRAPVFNHDPDFVRLLATIVQARLEAPA